MDCKPPGSSFLGISQVRILGWMTISSSKNSNYTPTKMNFKNALIHLILKLSMNRTHRYRNQDGTAQDSWETKRRAQKAESHSRPARLSTPWHSRGPWYFLFASLGICEPYIVSGHIFSGQKHQLWEGETEPAGKDKWCRERLPAMPRAIPGFGIRWQ